MLSEWTAHDTVCMPEALSSNFLYQMYYHRTDNEYFQVKSYFSRGVVMSCLTRSWMNGFLLVKMFKISVSFYSIIKLQLTAGVSGQA